MDVGKTRSGFRSDEISDCDFSTTDDAFYLEQWYVDMGYLQYLMDEMAEGARLCFSCVISSGVAGCISVTKIVRDLYRYIGERLQQ